MKETSVRWSERGQVTLLGLGLLMVLLFVGGMSLDLARAFSERRALAEVADAAAAAGANGIDVTTYRRTGELLLDPVLARELVYDSVATQSDVRSMTGVPVVDAGQTVVVVEVQGEVPLTLLGLFTLGEPLQLRVRAEASPRRGLSG